MTLMSDKVNDVLSGSDDYVYTLEPTRWHSESELWVKDEDESIVYLIAEEARPVKVDGVGSFQLEVQWGGQGDGAKIGQVIKLTDGHGYEYYFERTGRYSSWDSTYFGKWVEVEPYEKTVVRYRAV